MKSALDAVFKDTGRKSEDYLNFIRLDPMYRLVFEEGKTHIDCHDLEHVNKMESELLRVFGSKAVDGFKQWLQFERRRYPHAIKLLQKIYSSHLDIINWDAIKSLPTIGLHKSMIKFMQQYYENPLNQISFSYQSKYLGMSPWQTPSTYGLVPYAEYSFGLYHVEG